MNKFNVGDVIAENQQQIAVDRPAIGIIADIIGNDYKIECLYPQKQTFFLPIIEVDSCNIKLDDKQAEMVKLLYG
jgi:hypothetical protein